MKNESQVSQSDWEQLIAIRGEARELYRTQLLNRFERAASAESVQGYSQAEESTSVPDKQLDELKLRLSSDENLRLLQKIEDSFAPDSEDERKIRRLRHYLMSLRVENSIKAEEIYLRELPTLSRVEVRGRKLSLSEARETLATSKARDFRQETYYALLPTLEKQNAVVETMTRVKDSVAFDLGYGDYTSLQQERQELDFGILGGQALEVLSTTDSIYTKLAAEIVPRTIGLQTAKVRGYDDIFLTATLPKRIDVMPGNVIATVDSLLSPLGFTIDTLSSLSIKVTSNGGTVRPATFAISIPDDIRILVSGEDAYSLASEFLHELGHALHHTYTLEREFEYTSLGGRGLTETYAFLLEGLLSESSVLEESFGLGKSAIAEINTHQSFMLLRRLREVCGEFILEREVYSRQADNREEYEKIFESIRGYDFNDVDKEFLYTHVNDFESAEYLTGLFLSEQLREHLSNNLGTGWSRSPEAGRFLVNLWHSGSRMTAVEVARSIGIEEITPEALIRRINKLASFD